MKFMQGLFISVSVFALLGLSSCARYKAHSLRRLPISHGTAHESVIFNYTVFNRSDCNYYLDRNVMVKGYLPIQLTIVNNTSHPMYFSTQAFSFPVVPYHEVARKVYTSTAGRAAGYGVAGIFIWPFLIPAIVDGVGSARANDELDIDFDSKTLRDQVIQAGSSLNGLVFVPSGSFAEPFAFTLVDMHTNKRITLSSGN